MRGARLRLLEAVGLAFDGDEFGIVGQSIDKRDDTGGIGEHLVPLGEGAIGGNERALLLVAPIGQFEQQIGVPIGVRQVADLIDLC